MIRRILLTLALLGLTAASGSNPITGRLERPISKYFLSGGQSLSTGGGSNGNGGAITTTQPYRNVMFNGGTLYEYFPESDGADHDPYLGPPAASIASLVPLIEGVTHNNESHVSAFADQISAWARRDGLYDAWDSIGASYGLDGTAYSGLQKGTVTYNDSIASVSRLKLFLRPNVSVPAIIWVHGEADGACAYSPKEIQLQADYESDIKSITGQSGIIPLFTTQVQRAECNSAGAGGDPTYTGMLGAHEQNPTKTILVGPKYMLPYISGGLHLTSIGYRWLAEYYAMAFYQHVVQGVQWEPLRPSIISTSGSVTTIQYTGFVAPLVFDTTAVAQAPDGFYGFKYGQPNDVSIANVAITDATAGIVQITYSGPPQTFGLSVQYGAVGSATGPVTGARGNLRDSTPLIGLDGQHLYKWCVHFSKKLTYP